MALYKVVATTAGTGPSGGTSRRARCQAANLREVLQKLIARYPALDTSQNISLNIQLDDEEEL